MAYIDSVNKNSTDYALTAFNNVLICSDAIGDTKNVTFPIGFNKDSNMSFKVVFVNGHNCVDASTPLTITPIFNGVVESAIPVVVNQYGTLIPLPIHEITSGTYQSLQPNTVLEMYYTTDYSGGAFVVIGNPIVLSSTDYTIYADGYVKGGYVGDVKAISYSTIPSYGWLECNGQVVLQSDYPQLYQKFSNDNLLTVYNANHTGLDTTTQFAIPDYREVALVGVGQNDSEGTALATHDIYTVGQFKDDQIQDHRHIIDRRTAYSSGNTTACVSQGEGVSNGNSATMYDGRHGDVTHGKQKGIKYIIKVL